MKFNDFKFMVNIVGIILICLFLNFRFANAEGTPEYLGEFCWEVLYPNDTSPDILQLGVLSYGAGHFPVHGTMRGDELVLPIHGNAELSGSNIVMTLTFAEVDPVIVPSVMYVSLDSSTLKGTFQELISETDDLVNYFFVAVTGTFTPITCP